jgi:penicillin-binding protein 1B
MALGAYEGTPVEMAAAYTVFANNGTYISPAMINSVRDAQGNIIDNFKPELRPVLDPRVAAVLTNMMEAVINAGTGSTVRARGLSAPAAGKTGTSHDGWFAGFTSNIITVVWIGYDDYSDLRLSGSQTAAPIWAEFMKKAVALPQYKNTKPFAQPSGVVDVRLDKATNRLATATCPESYVAAFVAGTEPHETCDQVASDGRNFFEKLFGVGSPKPLPPPPVSNTTQRQPLPATAIPTAPPAEPQKKKKGFFGKIFGVFTDDDEKKPANPPPAQPAPQPQQPR